MTYQQEKAAADAVKAKRAKKFVFSPVLFDRRVAGLCAGDTVVKVQPYGCPRNGTMGQTYVGDAVTGKFIGMVCENSLTAKGGK